MIRPVRLQLSRAKGFRLQQISRAANGLPAINCARPSRWGNPFRIGEAFYLINKHGHPYRRRQGMTASEAVDRFRRGLMHDGHASGQIVRHLTGHNLACWCGLDQPCHADVLLELANP